jgi:outer membrane lipoprotein SlyB
MQRFHKRRRAKIRWIGSRIDVSLILQSLEEKMRGGPIAMLVVCLVLAGCQRPGQNVYNAREVGRASLVNFGTVVAMREVNVQGQNTGAGAAVGAAAGGIGGSQIGQGGGNAAAALGGVVVGALVGALVEQAAANRTATEYVVTMQTGVTLTLVQDHNEGEAPINVGDRVMVQLSGGKQRVLPAGALPTEIKRPQGIKVVD